MKDNGFQKKGLKGTIMTAAVVIGASTILFQGFTQAATMVEFNKTNTIPTSYATYAAGSSQTPQHSLPEGYKKADYTVGEIDLEYYKNQTPASKDMTKENAAEIGAQALWEVFGLDLEGQEIRMGYQPSTENLPRSNWYADVYINGERSYSFSVDSVTGELFTIGHDRTLDVQVSVAFDAALNKNPQQYVELAKKLAEKYNVVHSAVKSVEYNGQGYSNNDPTISVDIEGENGEVALMSFSRHDQELLGISYNTEYKYALESNEKFIKEFQKKIEELEKSAPPAGENEAPSLRVLE